MAWPPTSHQDVREAVDALRAGPRRTSTQKVTASLEPGASEQSTVDLGSVASVYRVSADKPCRVRLYTSTAQQTADLNRAVGTAPATGHGLQLEVVLTASLLSLDVAPVINVISPDPDGIVPITVQNNDAVAGPVTVTFTYLEVGP